MQKKEMNTPAVSVIIAVYQCEKHIERCCRSLFGQTLEDIEFVFVNDGSTDSSVSVIKAVLEDFPDRKARTKIIDRSENRGVSYSRQEGLDNATGTYVIHCDSDDWVELSMYERMYREALAADADVVCCGYEMVGESGVAFCEKFSDEHFFDTIDFNIHPLTGALWAKLVRHDMILANGLHFPENVGWGEDFTFSVSGLLVANKIVCLKDYCPYHYWLNEQSITHTLTEKKVRELMKVASLMEVFLGRTSKLNKYRLQLNFLKFQTKLSLLAKRELRNIPLWKESFPECHADIWKYDSPFSLKLAAWLVSQGMTPVARLEFAVRDFAKMLLGRG